MVDKQKSLQDLRQEKVKANGGVLSNLLKTRGVEEPLREAPVPDTSRPRPLTSEENAASHGMKPLTKEQSELATGRKLTPEENTLTHTGNLTTFDRSQSIADKINASGTPAVDEEGEVVPESEFGVVDYNADPENDPSLFEPALFTDTAYDYWNTAEPAEPEERSLFESPSFQQSALTFGLTLMMGGSFQDAMYNGGEAFSRSEYKNTDEYNEMLNMGIPGYIIEDAYISGDAEQLNSFYKTRQDIIAKAEEAEAARLNPAMSEEVRAMYKNFGDQAHELTTRNTALAKILGSYDPKSVINPIQQIELLYSLAKANDPDSAVKEAEIALNRLGQSWPADVKLQFSRVFTGEATADTLDPEYARLLADHLHNKYKSEWISNMNQFETLNKQSDYLKIARDKQFWRTQQQQFAKNQFSSTGINLTGE